MTEKEKALAYDKALKVIKECNTDENGFITIYPQEIFPELAESEDERIRKEMIFYFTEEIPQCSIQEHADKMKEFIAWLEKQGNKPVDKVESKFHEGEWVVNDTTFNLCHILKVKHGQYICDDCSFPITKENEYHLWTIDDAKEGDVLAYVTDEEDLWIMIYWSLYAPYEGHVHYHALLVNDNFSDKGTCCICINDLKPATKEQRELLFQKMNEAGYQWDNEKKEPKKIEKKPVPKRKAEGVLKEMLENIDEEELKQTKKEMLE